jgi:hypothetical protein
LYRVDLYKGWENDTVIIRKIDVTKWFDAYFKLLQKKITDKNLLFFFQDIWI